MPIIGLDIGKHRFRAVEIEKTKQANVLKNFGEYFSPDITFNLNSPESIEAYTKVLKDFIKDHGFSTSHINVSLPEQDVFIRVLETPYMSKKELRNFIELGADEYIPIPLAEATFDAQIIDEPDTQKNSSEENKSEVAESKMSVLLVASRNTVLEKYVAFLKQAGLTPKGIEPETLAMERVLGDTKQRPSATIIVNIGLISTQIIISYKGFVRFTRSIPIGGDALTKTISKELGLDYVQAEEYKKAYGLDESQVEGKVFNAIKPIFDNILLEIKRSKTFYSSRNTDTIVNRVILAGGSALMPGLLAYIVNKLDVEAELANPWQSIKISEKISNDRKELVEKGPVYATAVGLALKDLV